MGAGDQDSNPAPAGSAAEIKLYVSKGCLCAGETYAKDARSGTLLFSLSKPFVICGTGSPVLTDAYGAPLLHYTEKGGMFSKRVDVFRGDAGALAFTVKKSPSLFSQSLHILMAGAPSDGPPAYTLKPASFSNSLKIYRNDTVVAKVKGGALFSQADYQITIFPGIDQAMAVLLVAIYDDLRPKSSGGGGGGGGGGCGGGGCGGGG
ncbi:hypothetical protein L7F22_012431 [Adiantum nelumboides]|nr:hypothetical protein [Adiantum nelumboides]